MGKHSQETKAARRHVIVDKVPVLAAMIIAAAGWGVSLFMAPLINGFITAAVPSYPLEGLVGYIIGAVVIMLLYKWWFRLKNRVFQDQS